MSGPTALRKRTPSRDTSDSVDLPGAWVPSRFSLYFRDLVDVSHKSNLTLCRLYL